MTVRLTMGTDAVGGGWTVRRRSITVADPGGSGDGDRWVTALRADHQMLPRIVVPTVSRCSERHGALVTGVDGGHCHANSIGDVGEFSQDRRHYWLGSLGKSCLGFHRRRPSKYIRADFFNGIGPGVIIR